MMMTDDDDDDNDDDDTGDGASETKIDHPHRFRAKSSHSSALKATPVLASQIDGQLAK